MPNYMFIVQEMNVLTRLMIRVSVVDAFEQGCTMKGEPEESTSPWHH